MERQRYSDEDLIEREIEGETTSPEPPEETEIERRSGPNVLRANPDDELSGDRTEEDEPM